METVNRTLCIPSRFIGPDGVVNGGHLAGILEREAGGPVDVAFRRPTPPDRSIRLEARGEGELVVCDGEVVLATARKVTVPIEVPGPVSFELATEVGGARAIAGDHPFPRCFVCGPARAHGDALRVFPGTLAPGRVAAPVEYAEAFCAGGFVRREHVTATLDCPGGWAIQSADEGARGPMLLAAFTLRHEAPVRAEERCVVVGQASGADGRKRFATTAVYGEDGTLRAYARALWVLVA